MGNSTSALGRSANRVKKNQRHAAAQLRKLSAEMKKCEDKSYLTEIVKGLRNIDLPILNMLRNAAATNALTRILVELGIAAAPSLITAFLNSRTIAPHLNKIQSILDKLDGNLRRLGERLKKSLDENDASNIESGLRNRTAITIGSQRHDARKAVAVVNRTIEALKLFEQNGLSGMFSGVVAYISSLFSGTVAGNTTPVLQITSIVEGCLKSTHNVTTAAELLDKMANILEG